MTELLETGVKHSAALLRSFNFLKAKILRPIVERLIQLQFVRNGSKHRYVFVLAHMRSGSTLLTHLLANNPNFVQAGESFLTYNTPGDLQKLVIEVCRRLRKLHLSASYVIDQVNHPFVADEVLNSTLIYKCFILVRSPESAIKSLIAHQAILANLPIKTPAFLLRASAKTDSTAEWDMSTIKKAAIDYYVNRLGELAKCGALLGPRAMLVEYNNLVDFPERTLAAISEFLGATQHFDVNYTPTRITGKGFGDASRNIFVGRIIRTEPHNVEISAEDLAHVSAAYQDCLQRLRLSDVQFANGELTVGWEES